MKNPKLIAAVIILTLATAITGMTAFAGLYIPGTYIGTGKGIGGQITVTITVTDSIITDVIAEGSGETPGIGDICLKILSEQIKMKQSADVDVISGATVTSNGIKEAAASAIAAATITGEDHSSSEVPSINNPSKDDVSKKDINSCSISVANQTAVPYTGKPIQPAVVIKDGKKALTEGVDYQLAFTNNTEPGTAAVAITGINNYTGTANRNFTIGQADNAITVEKEFVKTYSKKKQTFPLGAKQLGDGKMSYSSNNNFIKVDKNGKVTIKAKYVGEATIKIKVRKNTHYKGAETTVRIIVNPTPTKLVEAAKTAGLAISARWKKNESGTGYQIQYSLDKNFNNAVTLNITGRQTTRKKITGLKNGGTYYVRIRVKKNTVPQKNYYSKWSNVKKVKVKVGK